MGVKQDRPAVRTAAELERKLSTRKRFREVMELIDDSRDSVDSSDSSLFNERIDELANNVNTRLEQITTLFRDTESVLVTAMESYVETGDYNEYKKSVSTQLELLADEILMNFTEVTNQITNVDGDLQSKYEEIKTYISFSNGGITLGSNENAITLTVEHDAIIFKKNGIEFGSWDGDDFYTGNIVVKLNERAQFGNFAFVPRSNGNLSFLKVGG